MSVYTQEVLGLLRRNKKKKKLDKIRDHFEFGKLYQNSTLNTGAAYNPTMEPFVIKWGDFKCATEEGMVRQDPTGTEERYITMWTDPVFQGECQTATITKTIISQNAIGDTINIAGDLYVDGTITTPTLTEDRIVIVGPGGVLEDDGNFTMDGVTFTALVNVQHGSVVASPGVPTTTTTLNSNIILNGPITDSQGNLGGLSQVLVGLADGRVVWSDDDVVEALTYGSLWQGNSNNLKQELAIGTADQILISDGTTFSWEDNPAAIVGEVCTVNSIPLWTPDSNTLGCSKLFQDGNNATPATKVTSSVTFNVANTTSSIINVGNVAFNGTNRLDFIGFNNFSSGLSSTSNGNTIVSSFYTSTAIDAYNNYIDMYYTSGSDTNKLTIGGNSSEVVHPGLVNGSVQILPDLELEKVDDDNTLDKVLVRDVTTGIIKQRDASTIKPQVGFDTLAMLPDGWASAQGNFNAAVALDDTTTAVKSIKDMDWLVDGDRVVVIAANVKTGSLLADNVIQFPTWNSSNFTSVSNHTSWNQSSIGTGWTGAINNGYQTSTLLFGEKLKFKAELYEIPTTGTAQLNWDACCKIYSENICPIVNNAGFTTLEDTVLNGTLITSDNGYGGYGNTFSIVTPPTNGTVTLNASTGAFVYTPNVNYFGLDSFTYQVNDGYCTSNIANVNITITSVPEAPVFTSLDPTDASYGANAWTNLTGGDVLTTYNWTTADPDHPCTDLTYSMSLVDASGNAGTWLTFTPVSPGNCTGTLSGTYPPTAGVWTVILTVTDPDGLSGTQEFTISGIVPDKDTYFAFWVDNSGSMGTLMQNLARQVSIGRTIIEVTNVGAAFISCDVRVQNISSYFIDDIAALVAGNTQVGGNGYNMIPTTNPTGVTNSFSIQIINTANGALTNTTLNVLSRNNANLNLDGDPTTQGIAIGDYLLLTISDQLASADYADPNSLRSLFQNFYATGGTESGTGNAGGVPNTDPATNGRNRYSSHVKFGLMNGPGFGQAAGAPGGADGEDWYYGLANYGYQDTQAEFDTSVSTGGTFEDASSITTLVWGDEASGSYDVGGGPYTNSTGIGGQMLINDVSVVQNWINFGPNASINGTPSSINAIGCMFAATTGSNIRNIGISAGVRSGVGFGDTAGSGRTFLGAAGWTNANLMIQPTVTTPRLIEFAGYNGDPNFTDASGNPTGIAQNSAVAGYYQNLVRTKLLDLGFQNI